MPSVVTLGLRIEWDNKAMGELEVIPGIYEEEDRVPISQWELVFIWRKISCRLTLRRGELFSCSLLGDAKVRVVVADSGKLLLDTWTKK